MSESAAPQGRVFPFYVVCEVSRSTWDPELDVNHRREITPMELIDAALVDILTVLEDDPVASDTAYLSVIAFGDFPETVVPLTPLWGDPLVPPLPRHDSANYADVLRFLDSQLRADHRRLQHAKLGCYPPLVFFIVHADPQVNGAPQTESEWLPLRQALGSQDHPMRPIVVALGMGNVSETTVRGLASTTPRGAALIADGTATPGDAVHAVLNGVFWWRTRSEPLDGELRFRTPPGMRMLT